jgi:hypothetical protein
MQRCHILMLKDLTIRPVRFMNSIRKAFALRTLFMIARKPGSGLTTGGLSAREAQTLKLGRLSHSG